MRNDTPHSDLGLSAEEALRKGDETQDPAGAIRWYTYAALRGDEQAKLNLGKRYFEGLGIPPDKPVGEFWLRSSTTKDAKKYIKDNFQKYFSFRPDEAVELALSYEKKMAKKPQDLYWAWYFWDLAARRGNREAMTNVATLLFNYSTSPLLPPYPEVMARFWWMEAALCGSLNAITNLTQCFGLDIYPSAGKSAMGDSTPMESSSLTKYDSPTDDPFQDQPLSLQQAYDKGRGHLDGSGGFAPDPVKALFWFRYAALRGHSPSMLELGKCYLNGTGTPRDLPVAEYWLRLSSEGEESQDICFNCLPLPGCFSPAENYTRAQFYESAQPGEQRRGIIPKLLYRDGLLDKFYYEAGALRGHVDCMVQLSRYLREGKGAFPEIEAGLGKKGLQDLSLMWLRRAALCGNVEALEELRGSYGQDPFDDADAKVPADIPTGRIPGAKPLKEKDSAKAPKPTAKTAATPAQPKAAPKIEPALPAARPTAPGAPPQSPANQGTGPKPFLGALPPGLDPFEDKPMTLYQAYCKGKDEVSNPGLSLYYYLWAALRGDFWAKLHLTKTYLHGTTSVAKDIPLANRWILDCRSFKEKNHAYGEAFYEKNLKQYAERTSALTAYRTACNAREGTGGQEKDLKFSAEMMLMAAKGGYPDAMNDYALYLYLGMGVAKDEKEAKVWMMRAVAAGCMNAMKNLRKMGLPDLFPAWRTFGGYKEPAGPKSFLDEHRGEMPYDLYRKYRYTIDGDPRFLNEMKAYCEETIGRGHDRSLAPLAWILWELGEKGRAAYYLSEALYRNHEEEVLALGPKDMFDKDINADTVADAANTERDTLSRIKDYEYLVYDLGAVQFCEELGTLYLDAWEDENLLSEEESWGGAAFTFALGGSEGYYYCMFELGVAFYYGRVADGQGKTGTCDYKRAAYWFEQCADDVPAASSRIGTMYWDGNYYPQSKARALEHFRSAADRGDYWGAYCLGDAYYYGDGVPQDKWKAYDLFDQSASAGYYGAVFMKAKMLWEGDSVPQDWEEALRLLEGISFLQEAKELADEIRAAHPGY